ncbi:hypothetical protein P9112_002860 [Eukaryota sp. TZLM1-RC]
MSDPAILEDLIDYEEAAPTVETAAEHTEERTATGIHSMGFKDFLLQPRLLKSLAAVGFEHPSEIQKEALPQVTLGHDVLGQAKSGMGKTAVFVLGILQQITQPEAETGIIAVVIAHTRELAQQIHNEFDRFGKLFPIRCMAVFGGIRADVTIQTLKQTKPQIIVATPGRLHQLVREKHVELDKVRHFVIDEADRVMSDINMRTDVQEIFMKTPRSKQTLMFSATMPPEMLEVCKNYMQNPIVIRVDEDRKLTLHGLLQYYAKVEDKQKSEKLMELMDELEFNQVVIFVQGPGRANRLAGLLREHNFPTLKLHGGMHQNERTRIYEEFRSFKGRILVATDLVGRGIDIEKVNVVINFDMPPNSDTYLHRVGRAGRFQSKGLAVSFVTSEDDGRLLDEIQSRFEVKLSEMTEIPEASLYS